MKLLTTLLLATLAALTLASPTTSSNNAANVLNARDECDICHDKEAECRAVSPYPTSNRLPSGVLTRYYLVLLLLVEPHRLRHLVSARCVPRQPGVPQQLRVQLLDGGKEMV
jgi:hypothetical protein